MASNQEVVSVNMDALGEKYLSSDKVFTVSEFARDIRRQLGPDNQQANQLTDFELVKQFLQDAVKSHSPRWKEIRLETDMTKEVNMDALGDKYLSSGRVFTVSEFARDIRRQIGPSNQQANQLTDFELVKRFLRGAVESHSPRWEEIRLEVDVTQWDRTPAFGSQISPAAHRTLMSAEPQKPKWAEGRGPTAQFSAGVLDGIGQFGLEMLTPTNIALMLAWGAAGPAARALKASGKTLKFLDYLSRGASGWISWESLKDAASRFMEAYRGQDPYQVGREVGQGIADLAVGIPALSHSIRRTPSGSPKQSTAPAAQQPSAQAQPPTPPPPAPAAPAPAAPQPTGAPTAPAAQPVAPVALTPQTPAPAPPAPVGVSQAPAAIQTPPATKKRAPSRAQNLSTPPAAQAAPPPGSPPSPAVQPEEALAPPRPRKKHATLKQASAVGAAKKRAPTSATEASEAPQRPQAEAVASAPEGKGPTAPVSQATGAKSPEVPAGAAPEPSGPSTESKPSEAKPAEKPRAAEPVASPPAENVESQVARAILELEESPGVPITLQKLKRTLPNLSEEEFSSLIENLVAKRAIHLIRHDHPEALTPQQVAGLVKLSSDEFPVWVGLDVRDRAALEKLANRAQQGAASAEPAVRTATVGPSVERAKATALVTEPPEGGGPKGKPSVAASEAASVGQPPHTPTAPRSPSAPSRQEAASGATRVLGVYERIVDLARGGKTVDEIVKTLQDEGVFGKGISRAQRDAVASVLEKEGIKPKGAGKVIEFPAARKSLLPPPPTEEAATSKKRSLPEPPARSAGNPLEESFTDPEVPTESSLMRHLDRLRAVWKTYKLSPEQAQAEYQIAKEAYQAGSKGREMPKSVQGAHPRIRALLLRIYEDAYSERRLRRASRVPEKQAEAPSAAEKSEQRWWQNVPGLKYEEAPQDTQKAQAFSQLAAWAKNALREPKDPESSLAEKIRFDALIGMSDEQIARSLASEELPLVSKNSLVELLKSYNPAVGEAAQKSESAKDLISNNPEVLVPLVKAVRHAEGLPSSDNPPEKFWQSIRPRWPKQQIEAIQKLLRPIFAREDLRNRIHESILDAYRKTGERVIPLSEIKGISDYRSATFDIGKDEELELERALARVLAELEDQGVIRLIRGEGAGAIRGTKGSYTAVEVLEPPKPKE